MKYRKNQKKTMSEKRNVTGMTQKRVIKKIESHGICNFDHDFIQGGS